MNRRRFLNTLIRGSLAAAVIAALGQVVRFLSYQPPDTTQTVFPVGQAASYPPDSLDYAAEAQAYIGHDDLGLYALDAVCPHLGCLVEPAAKGGFVCPCHESRFDAYGGLVHGPATQPLRALHLSLDQGQDQLLVDRSKPVEPSTRLNL